MIPTLAVEIGMNYYTFDRQTQALFLTALFCIKPGGATSPLPATPTRRPKPHHTWEILGSSMYCVNGESEKTLHGCDFKRKHLYRGCILPRVEVRGNLIFSNESRAMPRCCRQFWRTQSDERIACIPASACKNPLAVCSSLRQVAVNKFSLRVCELVASSKSKFVHAFCSDGLME